MKKQMGVLAVAALVAALPLTASADEALAKSKACLSCHQVDKKVVGPAFKDVAAKYKGDKAAPAALAEKVKHGTKGTWGQIPMPAQNVTDEEAKKLVAWVLSL
ncbi:c-type cytochrome [Limnobacter humi]|uniref:C-type cytochrome n=1 Tax=Limnobacter humi TaxID=1778671 RepID=A0ABT1WG32_9BURK|nr:c-type cytochrome [Limnobacter humi]MCQ8896339.1 c-type cytochrome [Limnobacter humi]